MESVAQFDYSIVHLFNGNGKYLSFQYSILHATPPQSAVQSLLEAKDLVNEAGFVNVNKSTLQHIKYANVFAIGDCSSTPNSKTMAAAGKIFALI